jgi:trehalose 6-phosphate synthase/phosphatase
MAERSNRLIIISNRLPFQLLEKGGKITLKQSDGGLATALNSYFRENSSDAFEHKVWIGSADFPEKRWQRYNPSNEDRFRIEPIFIDSKIYSKYYNGFCNATLWPLFHYFPSYVVYDREFFEMYEAANRIFADAVLRVYNPGDTIWVHDYQLFMLPQLLREKIPDATIGFFLHIPFPSFEIFRLLHKPWKEKIVRGLLGADLIGFHTHEYVQHFLKTVRMVVGLDHHYRVIPYDGRLVKADLFPLGIDFKTFNETSRSKPVLEKKEEIMGHFKGKKIIFSVDRLDYTKGVTHRLSGYERFLQANPQWLEKVVFILVVVPSRQIISKYNERRKLIEEQVGSINGKYSTLQWQPIIYRYSHLTFEELSALYLVADVGLITPLRDGMNLVAKEYIASCSEKHGVLILSELAGAASELGEAILVNPLDENELANAVLEGLTLPEAEQRRRIEVMQGRLESYDVTNWVNDFFHQLREIKEQQYQAATKYINFETRASLVRQFRISTHRLVLVDYDGTLVQFARHPKEAVPGNDLLKLLNTLGSQEGTDLTIISGRDAATLETWFGKLPVTLVAEHGASIRRKHDTWEIRAEFDQQWKRLIRPTLELFSKRSPGSFIEEKNHTLAWHYRNVDVELGFTRSRELLDSLFHLVRNAQLQVIDGNKVIEVRMAGIDKGAAAVKLMGESNYDFVLAIGDDKTDEDMFQALGEKALTIKIGTGHSSARYSMQSPSQVTRFLSELAAAVKESVSRAEVR